MSSYKNYIYIYIYIYIEREREREKEMVDFAKMIKICGKVDKSNTYNGFNEILLIKNLILPLNPL